MRFEDLSYFDKRSFKEALHQYESALSEGRQVYMDADDLTDIAEFYMVKNREADANECITLATDLHPDAVSPQVFLSRQQLFHDNLDKAIEIAENISQQDEREVIYLWAEIYIRDEEVEKADAHLKSHAEKMMEELDDFLYDSACTFIDYELWDKAEEWAKRLREEYPDYERNGILNCQILIGSGRVAEAITPLHKLLDEDTFNEEAWLYLADAETVLQHHNEALEAIDYLLAINEHNIQGNLVRGHCLYNLHRYDEAIKQYEKYLEMAPNDVIAFYHLSVCLCQIAEFEKALTWLEKATEYEHLDIPEMPSIYMQFVYVHSKLGNSALAIEYLDYVYNNYHTVYDEIYFLTKGHLMAECKNEEAAKENFEEAYKYSLNRTNTSVDIAISWTETKYYENALKYFMRANEDELLDTEIRTLPYMAYCAFFLNEEEKYKEYLHRAAEINPELTEQIFSPMYPNVPITEYKYI